MTRTLVILEKELRDLRRNWGVLVALIVPAVLIPALAMVGISMAGLAPDQFKPPPAHQLPPALSGATPAEATQYALLMPFFMIWLVFPITIPSVLASNAIVGEKEAGTLEPMLATPIHTWELLLGKALASVIPALLLTWIPYVALIVAATPLTTPKVLAATLLSLPWLAGLAVLAPTITLLTVMLLVILSAWVTEVRTANQIGAVLVAPLVAMIVVQITQGMAVTLATVLGIGAVALALLAIALPLAVRMFRRETILVRWKQSGGG